MIACVEEIAYRMNYISAAQSLRMLAAAMGRSSYGDYLRQHRRTDGVMQFSETPIRRRDPRRAGRASRRARLLPRDVSRQRSTRPPAFPITFVQDNHSASVANTLRGLHMQLRSRRANWCGSSKARSGTSPSMFVAALRPSADGRRKRCRPSNFKQLYIPPGCAHGFCVLSATAQVEYKCTELYDPQDEIGHRLGRSSSRHSVAGERAAAVGARSSPSAAERPDGASSDLPRCGAFLPLNCVPAIFRHAKGQLAALGAVERC